MWPPNVQEECSVKRIIHLPFELRVAREFLCVASVLSIEAKCPLQKQKSGDGVGMSALPPTTEVLGRMSEVEGKAEVVCGGRFFRF